MTPTDRERIHDALRFYIDRVTWPLGDSERDRFMALRDEYAFPTTAPECGNPAEDEKNAVADGGTMRLSEIKRGDRVRLHYRGSSGVPHRLGDTWATVVHDSQHATAWTRTTRVTVEADVQEGERRITIEEIGAVERGGILIAERRQQPTPLPGGDPFPLVKTLVEEL